MPCWGDCISLCVAVMINEQCHFYSCKKKAEINLFWLLCVGLWKISIIKFLGLIAKFRKVAYILGVIAKLRKATISFVMSVRPSVRQSAWNNSASTWRIVMKFDISVLFENLSRKFKIQWNLTRITSTLHKDQYVIYHLIHFFLECEMFQTEVLEKIKHTFYVY
jgi:hypothetical protein